MFCPECGKQNADGAHFCSQCGTLLEGDTPARGSDAPPNSTEHATIQEPEVQAPPQVTPAQLPARNRMVPALAGLAVLLAIAIAVVGFMAFGRGSTNSQPAETQEQAAEKNDASEDATDDKDGAKEETATDEAGKSAEDKAAAQAEDKAALEAEHAQMRADAEAQGRQVFEGTVHVLSAEQVSERTDVPLDANGTECEARWRAGSYAVLDFDQAGTVRNVNSYSSMDATSVDTDWIGIGRSDSSYDGDSASKWLDYEGKRVCLSCGEFTRSQGVDLFWIPQTTDTVVLYELESVESDKGDKSSESDEAVEQSYPIETATTYETEDFTVTFPSSLAGNWSVTTSSANGGTSYTFESGPNWSGVSVYDSEQSTYQNGRVYNKYCGCSSRGKHVYIEEPVRGCLFSGSDIEVTLK